MNEVRLIELGMVYLGEEGKKPRKGLTSYSSDSVHYQPLMEVKRIGPCAIAHRYSSDLKDPGRAGVSETCIAMIHKSWLFSFQRDLHDL